MWWLSYKENITLHHLLHYLKSCRSNLPCEFAVAFSRVNLPWLFAAGICSSYLRRLFAVGICRGCLLREFAAAISRSYLPWVCFVYVTKPFSYVSKSFFFVSKSFLIESKPSLYVSKTFIISPVIWQKGESVLRSDLRFYLRFEIRPFAILLTIYENLFFNSVSFCYCRGSYGPP